MHVYRKTKEEGNWLYTVGYFAQINKIGGWDTEWVPLEDTSDEAEARALVNYLNGGDGKLFVYPRGDLG